MNKEIRIKIKNFKNKNLFKPRTPLNKTPQSYIPLNDFCCANPEFNLSIQLEHYYANICTTFFKGSQKQQKFKFIILMQFFKFYSLKV